MSKIILKWQLGQILANLDLFSKNCMRMTPSTKTRIFRKKAMHTNKTGFGEQCHLMQYFIKFLTCCVV